MITRKRIKTSFPTSHLSRPKISPERKTEILKLYFQKYENKTVH